MGTSKRAQSQCHNEWTVSFKKSPVHTQLNNVPPGKSFEQRSYPRLSFRIIHNNLTSWGCQIASLSIAGNCRWQTGIGAWLRCRPLALSRRGTEKRHNHAPSPDLLILNTWDGPHWQRGNKRGQRQPGNKLWHQNYHGVRHIMLHRTEPKQVDSYSFMFHQERGGLSK